MSRRWSAVAVALAVPAWLVASATAKRRTARAIDQAMHQTFADLTVKYAAEGKHDHAAWTARVAMRMRSRAR